MSTKDNASTSGTFSFKPIKTPHKSRGENDRPRGSKGGTQQSTTSQN